MLAAMDRPWTRETVCAALIEAFKRPSGAFLATPREVEAKLNWRLRVPRLEASAWRFLLVWAECQAGCISIEERRRGRGWTQWEFQQGWRRAADAIAEGLNGERINTAALLAGEAAEDRCEARGQIAPVIGFAPRHLGS